MIKTYKIVGIVALVLVTLCSCSNETVDLSEVPMLTKIIEVSVDGSFSTTILNYNGNKIVNIDKADAVLEFYYSGDLISKMVVLDKATLHKNTLDYSYSKDKLIKITSSDNYVINYVHKSDGTVSYEKVTKNSENIEVRTYHGTLYFKNGNVIKDEKIIEDASKGVLLTNTLTIVYDYQKNALNNILGFDKVFDFTKTVSSNNCVLSTESSSEKHIIDNQIISSIKRFDSKIEYNSKEYPTEIVSENILFGETDAKHLKSQLFYN